MSEKLPQFERPPIRVIGKAPEEEKKKVSEELGRRFRDGEITELSEKTLQEIQAFEYKKEPYEKEMISLANEVLNNFIARYDVDVFDIPERNIHILPPYTYKAAGFFKVSELAIYNPSKQLIAINKLGTKSLAILAKAIIHEMTHLKGFVSFDIAEIDKDDENRKKVDFASRRIGFMVYEGYQKSEKGEYYESFSGLNEAVVSELEQKLGTLLLKLITSSEVKKELEWQGSSEIQELKAKTAKKRNLSVGEIDYMNNEGEYELASYREQRRVLHYLAEEIATDTGTPKEEVLDLFFKAHFTGNILPIARMIDKTFGDGMFRALGIMGGEPNSAKQIVDYFRKQRIRQQNKSRQDENVSD